VTFGSLKLIKSEIEQIIVEMAMDAFET